MSLSPHDHSSENWLRVRLAGWIWAITPTCRDLARFTSEGRDRPLPLGLRMRLALHRMFCPWCARYAKQLDLIHEASRSLPDHTGQLLEPQLGSAAKLRIKRALRDAIEKGIIAVGGLVCGLIAG